MEMKEILALAAFYLSMEDVAELPYLKSGYVSDTFPQNTPAEIMLAKLLLCANLVRAEIASDYFPLIAREKITAADGRIAPSSLAKRLVDVKKITRKGKNIRFRVYQGAIETVSGEVEIEYSYLPGEAKLSEDSGFPDKVGARLIACGTAAEYCLIAGLFEEAAVWDKRFKDSLLAAQRKKSEIRVKPRIWE